MNASPRTSNTAGGDSIRRRNGTACTVRMFCVTTSPVSPSPRVAVCTSTPCSTDAVDPYRDRYRSERLATDTPGGRIGCDEFGMLIFERLQLTEQPVFFRIGNGRLIKDVVGIIMTLDLPAQRCRARQHIGRRHQENRRSDRRDPDGTPRASMRS